jgi:(E)-4-hydroxy-3-methylbut-2-enyl-diphosphate synthase
VKVGFEMLKALGLRTRGVRVVSCPSCSRQGFDVIRTVEALEKRLEHIKTPMSLSVLGCVVNGPGEARETDIGLTGGGSGKHMVYLSGVKNHHIESEDMLRMRGKPRNKPCSTSSTTPITWPPHRRAGPSGSTSTWR